MILTLVLCILPTYSYIGFIPDSENKPKFNCLTRENWSPAKRTWCCEQGFPSFCIEENDSKWCPFSPPHLQLCLMVCPEPSCGENECALRVGSCCDFKCLPKGDPQPPACEIVDCLPGYTLVGADKNGCGGKCEKLEEVSWCPASSTQFCFKKCDAPQCKEGECALRIGSCCDYECKPKIASSRFCVVVGEKIEGVYNTVESARQRLGEFSVGERMVCEMQYVNGNGFKALDPHNVLSASGVAQHFSRNTNGVWNAWWQGWSSINRMSSVCNTVEPCASVTACPAVQTNVDFPGNDLNAGGMWGRVPGHLTREQCAAWCKADSRCVGYTFVKTEPSADNCAVKSSWNEASRRPGSGCCDSQQITKGCVSPIFDVSSTNGQCMSGNYDIGTVLRHQAHTIHVELSMPTTFNTNGRQWILNLGQWNTGANHWIWNSNSMIQFGRWNGEQIQDVNILQCDSLTMVVEPSTEMKLFCKGQLVGTHAGSVPFDIQNGNLAVASNPQEQGFTGCVKQVRIWDRALTDDVVQQLN